MCYGPRPVRRRRITSAARLAIVASCLIAALATSASGLADTAPALRDELTGLQRAERSAALELFAAETALASAQGDAETLRRRAAATATAEQAATRRAGLVRRSLAITRARATRTLRALYMEGDRSDPIAVLLGAESLDAAMDGLDGLEHVTRSHRRLAVELTTREGAVRRAAARARVERAAAEDARRAAEAAAARLATSVARRASTLSGIRARSAASAGRLAAVEAAARAAQQRAQELQAEAAPPGTSGAAASGHESAEPEQPVSPAPSRQGTRTLVVDAVAYHLSGRTASGLPVGVGVIAVDPTVIPLGTRVFVPGYGPAVAADVGSAIKGAIIDLWMPSTAQALAWGRRTVTITVYA